MAKRYVNDIIGDDYKNWKPGDRILISYGTGSGKTTWIMHDLLRFAKEQGKYLVYYCNRRFLSMQVQAEAQKLVLNELDENEEGLSEYLRIRTYQQAEHNFDYPHIHALDETGKIMKNCYEIGSEDILYYVFDEAAYFTVDAAENAYTSYWYTKAKEVKTRKSISIFLTATPEPLLLYLEFTRSRGADLRELCREYIALNNINKKVSTQEEHRKKRWMYYYEPELLGLEERCASLFPGELWKINGKLVDARTYLIDAISRLQDRIYEEAENPFRKFFAVVDRAYHSPSPALTYVYQEERGLAEQYDYLDTFYYDDMAALASRIAASVKHNHDKNTEEKDKRRWLVFVRKFEDATTLRTLLRMHNCKSVAISASITKNYDGSPAKRNGSVRKTLETLVHEQKLDCDVLISTSVIDSGVSIHNATDLAICQPEKTSFLQMIGRVRVEEGQRLNLYIQTIKPGEIRGYRSAAEEKMLLMARLLVLNDTVHKSVLGYEMNMDEDEFDMDRFFEEGKVSFLPKATHQSVKERAELDPNRDKYLYYDDQGNRGLRQNINPMAVIYQMSQVYFYRVEVPEYDEDPYYYLKLQLSWLGKTYDPKAWIDYASSREALHHYLAEARKTGPMDDEEQMEFQEKCFELLSKLREAPECFIKAKRRYVTGSKKYPGLKILKQTFTELETPYSVKHGQGKSRIIDKWEGKTLIDNQTYWQVCPLEEVPVGKKKAIQKKAKEAVPPKVQAEAPVQLQAQPEAPVALHCPPKAGKEPRVALSRGGETTVMEPRKLERKKYPLMKVTINRGNNTED